MTTLNEDLEEEVVIPTDGDGIEEEGQEEVVTTPTEDEEEEVVETPYKAFKTQEEYDAHIQAVVEAKKTPEPPTPPVVTAPVEDELDKREFYKGYLDDKGEWHGEKPKDWNEVIRTAVKVVRDEIANPEKLAPVIVEKINELSNKDKKEIEDMNTGWDKEMDELATEGLIPKRGTEEYKEIDKQITAINQQYGIYSMKKGYELWKKIPKAEGGGSDYVTPDKTKLNIQKRQASLIGSSRNAGRPSDKKLIPYNELHSRKIDDLLDE